MKRSFFIPVLFFFTLLSLTAQEERVYTFHSDIDIQTDGKINIREEIKVYAAGNVFKRGITRALPVYRTNADGKRVKVSYKIDKILKNGRKEKFFTKKEGGDLVIYVGKKNVILEPEYYTYEVFYSSKNQLGFFDEFDELYWNVNGASDNRTDMVSCRITMPGDAEIINHKCYVGKYGSTSDECVSESENTKTFYAEAIDLEADELLTVAVSFTSGVVQQRGTATYHPTLFDRFGLVFITVALFLFLSYYYYSTWKKHGVDPPKPVVIPQFSPPGGLSPASAGMLQKEIYSDELVTSAIVSLAVKGFVRIKESEERGRFALAKKKSFTIVKLKDSDNTLDAEEESIMSGLFATKEEVAITGKYDKDVANMMRSFRTSLRNKNNPILNEGRNLKFHILPVLTLLFYIFILFYFFALVPQEQTHAYFKTIVIFLIPLIFVLFLVTRFIKKLRRWFLMLLIGLILLIASADVLFKFSGELSAGSITFLIGFPVLVISYFVYAYLIVRPGEKKLEQQAKIEGLKMYMSAAEERQMQYFNPPDITPDVFEQLLPYAIALNMDKIWGDKFQQKFLSALTGQSVYQPDWYTGTVMRPAIIGHSLRSSLGSNIAASAVNPKSVSSGGSWGSGSSGGGFAGGGGGGGRVGGW